MYAVSVIIKWKAERFSKCFCISLPLAFFTYLHSKHIYMQPTTPHMFPPHYD